MNFGSYNVQVKIYSGEEIFEVNVPVNSLALEIKEMESSLVIILWLFMLLLIFGAVNIITISYRESTIHPDGSPSLDRIRKAKFVMAISFVLVIGILYSGYNWYSPYYNYYSPFYYDYYSWNHYGQHGHHHGYNNYSNYSSNYYNSFDENSYSYGPRGSLSSKNNTNNIKGNHIKNKSLLSNTRYNERFNTKTLSGIKSNNIQDSKQQTSKSNSRNQIKDKTYTKPNYIKKDNYKSKNNFKTKNRSNSFKSRSSGSRSSGNKNSGRSPKSRK